MSKYRKNIFTKEHLDLMETVFKNICIINNATLEEFNGEADHVHLLVLYPPRIALSILVNSLKGVSLICVCNHVKLFKIISNISML